MSPEMELLQTAAPTLSKYGFPPIQWVSHKGKREKVRRIRRILTLKIIFWYYVLIVSRFSCFLHWKLWQLVLEPVCTKNTSPIWKVMSGSSWEVPNTINVDNY
jgi:hypothetical protein